MLLYLNVTFKCQKFNYSLARKAHPKYYDGMLFIIFILTISSVKSQYCGGRLRGKEGTLESLDYPVKYRSNSDCTYSLNAGVDDHVEITFVDMSIENDERCRYDYIEIWIANENQRFCGDDMPSEPIQGIGMSRIIFQSDGSASGVIKYV